MFLNIGIQFRNIKSKNPPPKFPTTPNIYINVDIVAANTACNPNNTGAINKNVNSSGSVIPETIAVNKTGNNNPATFFFFSCLEFDYIASAIPTEKKIFELPCNANPPCGNISFKGFVD